MLFTFYSFYSYSYTFFNFYGFKNGRFHFRILWQWQMAGGQFARYRSQSSKRNRIESSHFSHFVIFGLGRINRISLTIIARSLFSLFFWRFHIFHSLSNSFSFLLSSPSKNTENCAFTIEHTKNGERGEDLALAIDLMSELQQTMVGIAARKNGDCVGLDHFYQSDFLAFCWPKFWDQTAEINNFTSLSAAHFLLSIFVFSFLHLQFVSIASFDLS